MTSYKAKTVTPETALKRDVKQYLKIKGWFVFHILQGLGAYKGIADLCAIRKGRTVWIELKRPKGVQSENQRRFASDIEANGAEYRIVRSLDDVMDL